MPTKKETPTTKAATPAKKEAATTKAATPAKPASVFAVLSAIDCGEHIEKKEAGKDRNGKPVQLSYLSWAWAWHICKEHYPNAKYTIYENENGRPYFDDGRTCWVKTGVTIEGQEHIEYLPVMDYRNLSIPVDRVTSMDMNKAIQRSLTKALARHGLGLYIYAGEDLPWTEEEAKARDEAAEKAGYNKPAEKPAAKVSKTTANPTKKPAPARGSDEWNKWVKAIVTGWKSKGGKTAVQAFAATYATDTPDEMQDLIGCLEEDAFNYRLDNSEENTQTVNA